MKKLLIISLLLVLTIGVVVASDVDDQLKTPDDYGPIKKGCATYTTYSDRVIFVEKLNTPSVYFENSTKYLVYPVGGNIYYFEDTAFDLYGYCEAVEINGVTYAISIYQHSKLSGSEEKLLLEHMKEFNKINNLTPITP